MKLLTKKETWEKLVELGIVAPDTFSEKLIFDGMDLQDWDFERMDLSHASFTKADLTQTVIAHSLVYNSDFSKTEAFGGIFPNNDFRYANFQGASLINVDFSDCNLEHANFSSAYLSNGLFSNCNLRHTNFTDAYLQESNFTGADLTDAIFTRADLTGVDLSKSKKNTGEFVDAILSKKTDKEIRMDNYPNKGQRVTVKGSRNWTKEYEGSQGVMLGPSEYMRTDDIQLDTGEILQLYSEEYSFLMEDRDTLTGAMNRIALQSYLPDAINKNKNVTLICANIDSMKHFNMHNGHLIGDEMLKRFVTIVEPLLDNRHLLFRYAGDSFAIASINSSLEEVQKLAQQLCEVIRNDLSPHQSKHCGDQHCMGPAKISVSIGIASSNQDTSAELLIENAERKMYEAKIAGRDRVCA